MGRTTQLQACGALMLGWSLLSAPASAQTARLFEASSADGYIVRGQADLPASPMRGAVVLVAGTGLFDRDVSFGASGTARDLIFADLAQRLNARGLAAVRYDRRGVLYNSPDHRIDPSRTATATTSTMRDDLGAVYAWTMARDGLGARCVVLFGHSEGMAHIGRLAETGALAPALVLGMGAMLESPATGFHWRFTERDAYSLRLMDADGDGLITDDEVRANYERTPAAVNARIDAYLHPSGVWNAAALDALRAGQEQAFVDMRSAVLATPDEHAFPDDETPMASYQWWKSWFLDETPVAQRLAHWRRTPMVFHYGSIDSQTNYLRESAAGRAALGRRARFALHRDRGHTLGPHSTLGPMEERLADALAEAAAEACR